MNIRILAGIVMLAFSITTVSVSGMERPRPRPAEIVERNLRHLIRLKRQTPRSQEKIDAAFRKFQAALALYIHQELIDWSSKIFEIDKERYKKELLTKVKVTDVHGNETELPLLHFDFNRFIKKLFSFGQHSKTVTDRVNESDLKADSPNYGIFKMLYDGVFKKQTDLDRLVTQYQLFLTPKQIIYLILVFDDKHIAGSPALTNLLLQNYFYQTKTIDLPLALLAPVEKQLRKLYKRHYPAYSPADWSIAWDFSDQKNKGLTIIDQKKSPPRHSLSKQKTPAEFAKAFIGLVGAHLAAKETRYHDFDTLFSTLFTKIRNKEKARDALFAYYLEPFMGKDPAKTFDLKHVIFMILALHQDYLEGNVPAEQMFHLNIVLRAALKNNTVNFTGITNYIRIQVDTMYEYHGIRSGKITAVKKAMEAKLPKPEIPEPERKSYVEDIEAAMKRAMEGRLGE